MRMSVLSALRMHVHTLSFCTESGGFRNTAEATADAAGHPPIGRTGMCPETDHGNASGDRTTMQDIYNGISAAHLEGATWRKSQRSNSQGACVELARLDAATVAMRNSRDPQGAALIYSADAVRAMVGALRSGEFDYLVG